MNVNESRILEFADNVKVIPNEECVPKNKLLVMDMWFNATKRRRTKFKPRVRVWKVIARRKKT